MSKYEKDIKELIEQMNRQQGGMGGLSQSGGEQQTPQSPFGTSPDMGTDQSPHLMNQGNMSGSPDQSPVNPINSVRPMGTPVDKTPQVMNSANITTSPPPSGVSAAGDACPQCGTIHPPIPHGKPCPMAPVKVKDGDGEKEIDINKFLTNLKNVILSQADQHEIKDVEKLFKNIIVEVTKYLEGYSE